MPQIKVPVGALQAVYVGDFGLSTVLTKVTALRTAGIKIEELLESEYSALIDGNEQVGDYIVRATVSFYEDDMAVRLARGLSVSASPTATIGTQKYTLLFVHPLSTTKNSYVFWEAYSIPSLSIDYTKNGASIIQVSFEGRNRNSGKQLITKDTASALASALGVRTPFPP